jgi:menaquinol-cytochrome c reductase iron-sulfur subunit
MTSGSGSEEGGAAFSEQDRRTFLSRLTLALGALVGLLAGLPLIGFLFSPVVRDEPDVWRTVGSVDQFRVGETVRVTYLDPLPLPWSGEASRSAAWLRRETEERFTAFTIHCTHTGCPVLWVETAGLFMCHCHGGAFHRDGRVAAGPPPSPLPRQEVRVRNGHVEIRTLGIPLPGEPGAPAPA